jgi:ATP-binding cassette, subfamily B, bacterial PglK
VINNFFIFLSKNQSFSFLILSIALAFSAVLEIVGIGTIPLFVTAIVDIDLFNKIIEKINIFDLEIYFSNQDQILKFMTFAIILIFLIKNLFLFVIVVFEQYFNFLVVKTNSIKLYNKYLNENYSFHLDRNSSILSKNISHEVRSASSFLTSTLTLLRESLIFIFISILLMINSPENFLFVFVILTFFLILFYFFLNKKIKKRGEKFFYSRNNLIFTIEQSFGFIKEIILFKKKKLFLNEFNNNLNNSEFQSAFLNTVNKIPRMLFEIIAVIMCLVVVYYFFNNSREQLIPVVTLYGISLIRLIPSYSGILSSFLGIKFHSISFNYICDELKKNYQSKELVKTENENYNFEKKNKLVIKNLSFKYKQANQKVFSNINFEINSGNVIGIMGSSGSGKSTLADLLMGLYDPDDGSICFNTKNISKDPESWRKLIGYLSQDVFLLDNNIRNNIAIETDNNKIDNNLIEDVIKRSNCEEFIYDFPDKLESKVGERGVKLSGGQKQRIGIARVLYHNPEIFIFDEPTSGLDESNEKKIVNTICDLKKKNKIILLITHKISNLSRVDKILFIKNKKISIHENNSKTIEFIKENY